MNMNDLLTNANKLRWTNPDFWNKICPSLRFSSRDSVNEEIDARSNDNHKEEKNSVSMDDASSNQQIFAATRQHLLEDGYALLDISSFKKDKRRDQLVSLLREGILSLHEKNLPATMILLCDELWEYAHYANHKILKNITHPSHRLHGDILAWYVDPKEQTSGFSPHRDRQPSDNTNLQMSFHTEEDGRHAKYVTMWIALTPATPENSCLYVIPRPYDPGYSDGDLEEEVEEEESHHDDNGTNLQQKTTLDPLQRALPTKESFQNIRALPRYNPGDAVVFTHRLLHWGSRGNPSTSPGPRIALSFVSCDPNWEAPYISNLFSSSSSSSTYGHAAYSSPPFRTRLLLACAQLLIYYQRFSLTRSCLRACYDFCKQYENDLHPVYRKQVFTEFVKAMKETAVQTSKTRNDEMQHNYNLDKEEEELNDDDDDDDDDAVLDEILEAERQGYGEYQDDYDDIDSQNGTCDNVSVTSDEDSDNYEESFVFGKRKVLDSPSQMGGPSQMDSKKKSKSS
jgi:hypothetical protein